MTKKTETPKSKTIRAARTASGKNAPRPLYPEFPGKAPKIHSDRVTEIEELRSRLAEAEETLRAIRNDEIDALVVSKPGGDQVFTLKGAEHVYRVLVEEMNEGAVTLNAHGTILYCNNALVSMLGLSLEEVMGSSFLNYLAPDSLRNFSGLMQQSLIDGGKAEVIVKRTTGELLPVLLSARKLTDGEDFCWISMVVTDISLQKEAEATLRRGQEKLEARVAERTADLLVHQVELKAQNEELRSAQAEREASRSKYAELYDFAPIGYFTLDANEAIQDVNIAGAALLGLDKQSLLGTQFSVFVAGPDDFGVFSAHRKETFLKQVSRTCDLTLRRKNGSIFHGQLQSVAVENVDGKAGSVRMAVTDITLRKWAEAELRESESRYRSLIELSPDAIIVHSEGKFVYLNPAALELYGAPDAGKIIGKEVLELVHPDDRASMKDRMQHLNEQKMKAPIERARVLRFDGQIIDVETTAAWITFRGKPAVQVIIRDIRDRIQSAEAIREGNDRLEDEIQKLRIILESVPEGIVVTDAQSRIVLTNSAAEKLYARPVPLWEEVESHDGLRLYHPDGRTYDSRDLPLTRSALYGETHTHKELTVIWPDGQIRSLLVNTAPIKDAKGKIIGAVGAFQDMSDRKRMEAVLRESEAKYRGLFQNIQETVAVYQVVRDRHGRIVERRLKDGNPALVRTAGVASLEQLIGKTAGEIFGQASADRNLPVISEAINAGETRVYESRSEDGNRDYITTICPLDTDHYLATSRDITEFKQAEEALRRLNQELETRIQERTDDLTRTVSALQTEIADRRRVEDALRHSQDSLKKAQAIAHIGSWNFDLQSEQVSWSDELYRIFALDPVTFEGDLENVIPKTILPDDWEKVRKVYRLILSAAKAEPMEYRILLPDGTCRIVWAEAEMVFDGNGKAVSIMGTVQDITERKRAEEEVFRLAAAVESAADALVVTDPMRGMIQYVNPAFERMTGYAKEDVLGKDLHVLDSGKQDPEFYRNLRESLSQDGVWSGRLVNKKKDGTLYEEDCTYSVVRNASGEIINYISIKRDVTERIRLETVAQAVETMNNIGYIFSGVSHEIGSPINTLRMTLDLMKKKSESLTREKTAEYVERLASQVSRVEYLLKNLKNFNMYENVQPQKIEAKAFMESFLHMVNKDFQTKGIEIVCDFDPAAKTLFTDPRALQQILLNILTNASDAVEGRKNPKIVIETKAGQGRVQVRVQDNGIGIETGRQQDLFKPFYTTKKHGTGLGLVIIKKMLAKMNGTVEIISRLDEGTIVDISIPAGNSIRRR